LINNSGGLSFAFAVKKQSYNQNVLTFAKYSLSEWEERMKNGVLMFFVCLTLFAFCPFALAVDEVYHLAPGDVIEISVWKDPELSRNLVVPPDGIISFPLIGSVDVTHLSVPELRKIITKKLSEFIPDATVVVMLLEINSLKAFVIGKVNNPGEFPIDLETNVMQILAKAQGLNPFASKGNIKIIRQQDNKLIKIPFDYGEVEKGRNLEQNIILKPGDVVVVP
jgi:polysaccharide export outer membrane protein